MSQTFPVVLAVGCLAGLGWLAARRASSGEPDAGAFRTALIAIGLGLAGARLGFVALHLPYFGQHPLEALWLWEGGLSWVGGAVGVLIAIAVGAYLQRRSIAGLADDLALPAVLVALAAWAGCLLDRCMYGIPSDLPWAIPSADLFGTVVPRWPTAAAGMIATGLLASGLVAFQDRRRRPGSLGAAALGGLAAVGFGLSFTRGDPALLIFGIRWDAFGSLVLLLVAIGGAARAQFSPRPR